MTKNAKDIEGPDLKKTGIMRRKDAGNSKAKK